MLSQKQLSLAMMIISVLIIIVLMANSLGSVQLRAGTFAPEAAYGRPGGAITPVVGMGASDLILVLIIGIAACFGLYFLMKDKQERRLLLWRIVMVTLIVAFFAITSRVPNPPAEELPPVTETVPAPTTTAPDSEQTEPLPLPDQTPAEGIALFISAMIVLGVAVLVWLIWRRFRKTPFTLEAASPLDRLGHEARAAVDALEQGAEIRHVVLRCYRQMGDVLDEARGLRRKRAMTPREFEQMLVVAGLPSAPVQRLTRLFEVVRYSAGDIGMRQQQEAISSLIAIAEACGVTEIDGQPI